MGATSASAQGEAELRPPCEHEWLCVYDGPNGTGEETGFHECTDEPVSIAEASDGRFETLGSFNNNQIDGTVATFFGLDEEGNWVEQYQSTAPEFVDNDQAFETHGLIACAPGQK